MFEEYKLLPWIPINKLNFNWDTLSKPKIYSFNITKTKLKLIVFHMN